MGREQTFPESIINSINEKGGGEALAEMVTIGGIRLDEPKRYDVIIDRISHEIPYYRATLKRFTYLRVILPALSGFLGSGHDLKNRNLALDHLAGHDDVFDLLFGWQDVH